MPKMPSDSGLAALNNARIYYETAGQGEPFVMIHAGVADSRQWNNEFSHFAARYRVLRYDMRGYGRSEPVDGDFSHLGDLTALLDYLQIDRPVIAMGCSMGGGVAMNLALTRPTKVRALIMVGSGPTGLDLNVPTLSKFAEAEKAFEARDLDLTAEIETQIWFDGMGRTPAQVDQAMRKLVYTMNRTALAYEARGLGKRLPDTEVPAAERLGELHLPLLAIVGSEDTPYLQAAADYMAGNIPTARKAVIEDAAHLPNLDHPDEFERIVTEFLNGLAP
jgi:pimeloyl-ACP methyl ester carboxylesterase